MVQDIGLPGKALATRPLHFFWICDCSGSMGVEGKIQALNTAIRETIPHMQDAAREEAHADLLVRAIKFSDGAQWHVGSPTKINDFVWNDLSADGVTDMGAAIRLVAKELTIPPMSDRALPPVLVLISDGQPTDDFIPALEELERLPWGGKCVRISIAIGKDADIDVMERFVNVPEIKVLTAGNPQQLVKRIKWASTVVVKAVASPPSVPEDDTIGKMKIPESDENDEPDTDPSKDVW